MPEKPLTLPPWRLALYGLPGLPLAAATLPVYLHIPTYYAVDLGLGFTAVGGILLAARIWDAVTDPLVGFLSDRTSGRFGPRKPWILAGALLTAITGFLLFAPPEGAGSIYLFVVTILLYLGWTMAVLPYNAWGAELSDDHHHRTTITAWREGAVIAGTLLAVTLPHAMGDTLSDGLAGLGAALLLMLPIAAVLSVSFVPVPTGSGLRQKLTARKIASAIGRNLAFRRLLAAWFLNGIANGLPATLFLLFIAEILKAPEHAGLLLFTYFLSAVAGLPIWLQLSKRIGKHRTWCVAMAWACLWFASALALGPGDVFAFAFICVATGLALGADLALPPSLQADVIDLDRAQGGERNTGAYFALWSMAQKIALAAAVGIAFPLLDLAGFETTPTGSSGSTADPGSAWLLPWLYAGLPIVLKTAAMAIIWSHPISAETHADLSKKIAARDMKCG
ncbi:MFS transporter [Hwanghaeella sp.]|uniref:MFS transporter n=1 Tax=Hwanghaeella sp. TaxID=2605943 RepID=UPI003CCC204D